MKLDTQKSFEWLAGLENALTNAGYFPIWFCLHELCCWRKRLLIKKSVCKVRRCHDLESTDTKGKVIGRIKATQELCVENKIWNGSCKRNWASWVWKEFRDSGCFRYRAWGKEIEGGVKKREGTFYEETAAHCDTKKSMQWPEWGRWREWRRVKFAKSFTPGTEKRREWWRGRKAEDRD